MKIKCPKCLPKEGVEIPNFTLKHKQEIIQFLDNSPMNAINYIKAEFSINSTEAKFIVQHINKIQNRCNRCNFKQLDNEYGICPKCNSLNINWKR
ncbi:hypothetical protein C4F49_03900 [Sphingobacterium sp. KB22]|uniref:Uncharacterized protein n=1 Tax=Sphingobacterium hungaricum TaxID=2082723 RepID=A0A928UWW9_9SPHI|nr:hypothetical protein [Sphingobacterium hungaricum]